MSSEDSEIDGNEYARRNKVVNKKKNQEWQSKNSFIGYDKGKSLGKDVELRSKNNPTSHAPSKH
jgi:hypothetical protein